MDNLKLNKGFDQRFSNDDFLKPISKRNEIQYRGPSFLRRAVDCMCNICSVFLKQYPFAVVDGLLVASSSSDGKVPFVESKLLVHLR